MSAPQWGLDNWIYVAKGYGGTITGPNLKNSVKLGDTDFRIKPDGSRIEPVTGGNHTFGMALTDNLDRFLITTSRHALYAVPLPYHYMVRNPYAAAPGGNPNFRAFDDNTSSSQVTAAVDVILFF